MGKYLKHRLFLEAQEESRHRRASNRANSAMVLDENAIPYESRNGGAHLIVEIGSDLYDFWPGTGKWKCRSTGEVGRGVFALLEQIHQMRMKTSDY